MSYAHLNGYGSRPSIFANNSGLYENPSQYSSGIQVCHTLLASATGDATRLTPADWSLSQCFFCTTSEPLRPSSAGDSRANLRGAFYI